MSDIETQNEIYTALVDRNKSLETKNIKIHRENNDFTEKNRKLRKSLSDPTLLLAVDYEKLSAAFSILQDEYQ